MRDPCRHHDEVGRQDLTVVETQRESLPGSLDHRDVPILDIRNEALLEVERVLDEEVEAHREVRVVICVPAPGAIRREGAFGPRRAQVGGECVRLEHHPGGHVVLPRVERTAEDAVVDAERP